MCTLINVHPQVLYINGGGATSSLYRPRTDGGFNDKGLAFGLLAPVTKLAATTMSFMVSQMDAGKLGKPSTVALLWEDSSHGMAYQQEVRVLLPCRLSTVKVGAHRRCGDLLIGRVLPSRMIASCV